jgi:hypothetical protein
MAHLNEHSVDRKHKKVPICEIRFLWPKDYKTSDSYGRMRASVLW